MNNLDTTTAQAERLRIAAATLEANGVSVYRQMCYVHSFLVCTPKGNNDGFTANQIIAMAADLRGPAALANEEATR